MEDNRLDKNAIAFAFIMLLVALVLVSGLALIAEMRMKSCRVKLANVKLDRAGLNGMCKVLINQKFADKPYNSFNYELNLPDLMSLSIEVRYQKNYVISDVGKFKIQQAFRDGIAKITHEEWIKHRQISLPEK